jgi:hypothetical protein
MKVNNMRELLKYVEDKKKQRRHRHIEILKVYGECKGMGNRRYKVPQKSTVGKFKKYSYTARWNDYKVNTNKIG